MGVVGSRDCGLPHDVKSSDFSLQAELLLHALLFYDRLPALCLIAGIAAHVSYLRLLKPFPYLELLSLNGLTSVGLLLASGALWIRHFMKSYYTGEQGTLFCTQAAMGCRFGIVAHAAQHTEHICAWSPPPAVEYIAAFLLITTGLVPFAFFLGMSGDNAVLPGVSLRPAKNICSMLTPRSRQSPELMLRSTSAV